MGIMREMSERKQWVVFVRDELRGTAPGKQQRRRYQTFGKDGHCRYQQRPMINMSPTVKRERILMRERCGGSDGRVESVIRLLAKGMETLDLLGAYHGAPLHLQPHGFQHHRDLSQLDKDVCFTGIFHGLASSFASQSFAVSFETRAKRRRVSPVVLATELIRAKRVTTVRSSCRGRTTGRTS